MIDLSGRLEALNDVPHCRLNNDEIPYVDSVKNLGAWIDNKCRFDVHVGKKCQAAYIRLRSLYNYRNSLNFATKKLLANTTVLSLFEYCDFVYSPCLNDLQSSRVQSVQNVCIRFCYNVRKFTHVFPLRDDME